MFRLLGPGVLRVGGNSVDTTSWYTAASPDAGASKTITQADVDGLAAFAQAAGWSVLYGVNMKASTPQLAADEATYARTALGASLSGYEIGNEVDLYKSTAQSATWSYSIFEQQWQSYFTAIEGSPGGLPVTGPASATHYDTWTVPFIGDNSARIVLATQHYYRGDGKAATSTMAELLQPDPALVTELKALEAAVAQASASSEDSVSHYRLTECNSFYNGGAPGVSDAYGSALWAIDFLFTNARYGSSGANFHGGGNGPGYTPIADTAGAVVGARPIFYGLLFFSKIVPGSMVATTTTLEQNLDLSAYAVQSADKSSLDVVLVNKDPTTAVHATINAGATVASASALRLAGPALDATTGVTLGGAAVDPSGTWNAAPPETLPVAAATITVDVPPASATLVHAVTR
jgi:hypothetical protein